MPACQIELVSRPHPSAREAVADLVRARRRVADACSDLGVVPAAAAVHPIAAAMGSSGSDRHRAIEEEFGEVARRQLVGSLQVHVALGDAACALAVYNTLRGHLPELAALASSAPFYEGRDTGFASIRPLICGQLPRAGGPAGIRQLGGVRRRPCLGSEQRVRFPSHAAGGGSSVLTSTSGPSRSGSRTCRRHRRRQMPWPTSSRLLVRVPRCAPSRRRDPAGPSLVADRGEPLERLRDGVHGELADLVTGCRAPTARRLHRLLDDIEAFAPEGLDGGRALIEHNGADDLRKVGLRNSAAYLSEAFPA